MRQAVVVIETADLDGRALAWGTLLGREIVCVMPSRGSAEYQHRAAAIGVVGELTKNTDIVPVWPWESDAVSEG